VAGSDEHDNEPPVSIEDFSWSFEVRNSHCPMYYCFKASQNVMLDWYRSML